MSAVYSIEQLAETVNAWADRHGIVPVSGQAGERMTERNVRYYRTLGLLDAPLAGGGLGYDEKHRLQLLAIRLLQAQGLPLTRIRDLLLGRTLEELHEIEKRGLAEQQRPELIPFRPALGETWSMTPLDEEFLLISRRGRGLSDEVRERLRAVLHPKNKNPRRNRGAMTKESQ